MYLIIRNPRVDLHVFTPHLAHSYWMSSAILWINMLSNMYLQQSKTKEAKYKKKSQLTEAAQANLKLQYLRIFFRLSTSRS